MGQDSKIEWTEHTFNPWIGCTKVSPGCAHCYAERDMERYGKARWGAGQPRVRTAASTWALPARWNRAAAKAGRRDRVFCASLADVFDREVNITWLADLLVLIAATPHLDWLLLTKRPQHIMERLGAAFLAIPGTPSTIAARNVFGGWVNDGAPPANVWLGTTVEDQERANERIPELLKVPARVRFLSCEPLLGAVDIRRWLGGLMVSIQGDLITNPDTLANRPPDISYFKEFIHWIIAGGESGPKARPMHPDWARGLRDQAQASGVPFLFKQWGAWAPWCNPDHFTHGGEERHAHAWMMPDGTEGDCWIVDEDGSWSNWTGDPPEGMQVMGRHGKVAAGRLLDGRTWDEVPS